METQKIKCVVWDLDNTIWNGVLLEDPDILLNEQTEYVIKELDKRGILQSISSKNEESIARKKLEEFGLWEYFIYPQINWNAKSSSIEAIAKSINIGTDSLAFIDDQMFELEEVAFKHPEVMCIKYEDVADILNNDRMKPLYITSESKNRRAMYMSDIARNKEENAFSGTKEEFLATLDMVFEIYDAKEEDLQRAEELTIRTHQLNSTGYVYSYNELKELINDDRYWLITTRLKDKYGDYGTIGLALVEKDNDIWMIDLLLMSCRVMSKGVGNVLMNYLINEAKREKKKLRAKFVPTNKNRIMYITYKFSGFSTLNEETDLEILEADTSYERKIPEYIRLVHKRSR